MPMDTSKSDDVPLSGGAIAVHSADSTVINDLVVNTIDRVATLLKEGNREEAKRLITQVDGVVELAPDSPAPIQLIGVLVRLCKLSIACGEPKKATDLLAQISRYNDLSDPSSSETTGDYCTIGQVFMDNGYRPEARLAFERALSILATREDKEAAIYLARVRTVLNTL